MSAAKPLWGAALREQIVEGEPEGLIEAALSALNLPVEAMSLERVAPISDRRLRDYLSRNRLRDLILLNGEAVDSFNEMASQVTRLAALDGWSESRYVGEIHALAGLYGADGFKSQYASVWYQTFVVTAAYNEAQFSMLYNTPAGRLFPYLRYETQKDDRVREEHRKLQDFTAKWSWPGWASLTPPLGWNCRCWLRKIGWLTARRMGLSGTVPSDR